MMRKREPHWQSATERARVAAELIEEAELLTKTGGMATPAEVDLAKLPPPLVPAVTPEPRPVAAEPRPTPRVAPPDESPPPVRYETARSDLERALQADPANVAAHVQLAALLAKRGLRAEGLPHLRRAVELEPARAAAWFQLGELLNRLDDLAGARAAFERCIELEATHARALYGLGIVLDRLNRSDEATIMYRRSREAAVR